MEEDKKEFRIVIPQDSRAEFVNATQVTVADDAVMIQLAYIRPHTKEGRVVSEVVLSPKHAIKFSKALDAAIKQHFTRHLGEE